jgi:hypothetical protein
LQANDRAGQADPFRDAATLSQAIDVLTTIKVAVAIMAILFFGVRKPGETNV